MRLHYSQTKKGKKRLDDYDNAGHLEDALIWTTLQ